MAERKELFVGIDVGGTSVKEGLFTRAGELLGKVSVPTPPLVDEIGYAAVTGGIRQLLATADRTADDLAGIGLAVPVPPSPGRRRHQAAGQHHPRLPRAFGRVGRGLPGCRGAFRERRERGGFG